MRANLTFKDRRHAGPEKAGDVAIVDSMVSVGMSPAYRQKLEVYFACPECGTVNVSVLSNDTELPKIVHEPSKTMQVDLEQCEFRPLACGKCTWKGELNRGEFVDLVLPKKEVADPVPKPDGD